MIYFNKVLAKFYANRENRILFSLFNYDYF